MNTLKGKLLKEFLEFNEGELNHASEMKSTDHGQCDHFNPYHLEGSVWTHTCCVLSHAKLGKWADTLSEPNRRFAEIALYIAAICHDIGKIYTREAKKKEGFDHPFITFYSHEMYSVYPCISFLEHLESKNILSSYGVIDDFIELVPVVVGKHTQVYGIKTAGDIANICNYNLYTLGIMSDLLNADEAGQIILNSRDSFKDKQHRNDLIEQAFDIIHLYNKNYEERELSLCKVSLYCGIPGSGKDYLASLSGCTIFSTDQEILKKYVKDKGIVDNISEVEIYRNAFEYCKDTGFNSVGAMIKSISDFWEQGNTLKPIAICRTHLNVKSRRSILNELKRIQKRYTKNGTIDCKVVLAPLSMCMDSDRNRTTHQVGESVIKNFAARIDFPTMLEGFDDICIIWNTYGRKEN